MKKTLLTFISNLLITSFFCAYSSKDEFPTGTYTDGDLTIEFRDDGTYTVFDNGRVDTEGTYSVAGKKIRWITDSYCESFNHESATYKWKHQDDTLSFEVVGEDTCTERYDFLTSELTAIK